MKIASIDIGSNTVILLIIQIKNGEIVSEQNYYRIGKLGKGLNKGENIVASQIEILINIIEEFNSIILNENCTHVILTATNALRIAANGNDIAMLISKKYGYEMSIISGNMEAYYSYYGAAYNYGLSDKLNFVIDIGGGSTEIIIGNSQELLFKKSFQIGTVSLTDKFVYGSTPQKTEILAMTNCVISIFSELEKYSDKELNVIGVGGTPTSISGMISNTIMYDEDKLEGSHISKHEIVELSNTLSFLSSLEILKTYKDIVIGRNDVIFAGSIILKILFEILDFNKLIVSGKGLRYGVVYSKYLLNKSGKS